MAELNMNDLMMKVTLEYEEQADEFIFRHLQKYCDGVVRCTGETHVPKKLLERALICFRQEHKDEYNTLMGIKEE